MEMPSLNVDRPIDANRGFSLISENGNANSVDPDAKARHEPSHQDLPSLHSFFFFFFCLQG